MDKQYAYFAKGTVADATELNILHLRKLNIHNKY
jgi:hypothetical protein